MSKQIKLTEENIKKAYDEGCSDVKKVLKNLAPDVFEPEIEIGTDKVYAFKGSPFIYKLHRVSGGFAFVSMNNSKGYANGVYKSIEKAIDRGKDESLKVFDNEKDFFKWAYEQTR